ncbi:MAG TPA: Ger(x)C family spore germination protein [Bacillota bacterium]|nr:Ger(x)C family spore germination protein [Bacillota bacterium]
MYTKLLIAFCLLFTLSGCWDLEEVDRRVFATTIGIDLNTGAGDQVELSVQVPQPQKMLPPGAKAGESGKKFSTISTTAETTLDAFNDLQAKTNGELVIQQNKSIIMGEAAARRDVSPLLDWLLRSPKAPPQALVFIARGSMARDILSFEPAQESLPGLDFMQAAQSVAKYDRTYFIPVWKFGQKLVHGTKDTYAPLITLDKAEGQYVIAGLAVFNGKRMAGELSPEETQIFGILANLMKTGSITINMARGRKISLRNVEGNTTLIIKINRETPLFVVKTAITGSLSEMTGGYLKLTPSENRRLEKIASAEIYSRMMAVIRKLQQLDADTLDFGEQLRAQHPDVWEKMTRPGWKKAFPTVPFSIELKVKIQRDGIFR